MLSGTVHTTNHLSGTVRAFNPTVPAGNTDYQKLNNKPKINGTELTGDLTLQQLGLTAAIHSALGYAPADPGKLSMGIHTDGLCYLFVDGRPVGTGIEIAPGGDVVGYVDSENNIVVKGSLADGTYSVKYEMEDGSTVDIGELVLDTNVYYSVTNHLTNCTSSNSAAQAIKDGSYAAVISPNSGYELSSVTVTMGGTDITPSAVSGGNISIASVTGNIVITAVAAEIQTEPANPTNFAEPNETNKTDWSIWCNDARFGSDGGYRELTGNAVTNYIPFQFGDVIYIKGMTIATTGTSMNNGLATYGSDKTRKTASYLSWYVDQNYLTVTSEESTPYIIDTTNLSGLANASGAEYFRLSGVVSGALDDVVINIKRNGKWL